MTRSTAVLGAAVIAGVLAGACSGGGERPAQNARDAGQPPSGDVNVTLTTQPDPPRTGEATFEATVTQGGQPVTDASVSVELYMPAMPEMKMAEMRSAMALTHEGGGRYRGMGNVMMAGSWDATVTVMRQGQQVAAHKVPLVAKQP